MSATITKARLGKLPQWAVDYITKQDALIAYWRDQAKDVEMSETGIAWGRMTATATMEWVPIPEGAIVRFGDADRHFDATVVGDHLKVRSTEDIAITSSHSNSVFVVNVPHDWLG